MEVCHQVDELLELVKRLSVWVGMATSLRCGQPTRRNLLEFRLGLEKSVVLSPPPHLSLDKVQRLSRVVEAQEKLHCRLATGQVVVAPALAPILKSLGLLGRQVQGARQAQGGRLRVLRTSKRLDQQKGNTRGRGPRLKVRGKGMNEKA